jgi:methionyl-tRNA formyltransferase
VRGRVTVLVDNPSWIVHYAHQLVDTAQDMGFKTRFIQSQQQVEHGEILFMLGCIKIVPADILKMNQWNLVVHESDLPRGKGFAPLAWQVIHGKKIIPVVLFQAKAEVDTGSIIMRGEISLTGYELCDELRQIQGAKTLELCTQFLSDYPTCTLIPQSGETTFFRRRIPADSRLDPDKTIREQFNLLRTVDNQRYPAFFEVDGHSYEIQILRRDKML